jgi:hypothetical protein
MDLINEYHDELVLDDSSLVSQLETLDPALESVSDDILSTNDILFTDDILSSEISIPEFPQKININHNEEMPSLNELSQEPESLEKIISDIEAAVNFDSFDASMYVLNNPEFLMNRIQSAFDVFRGKR